MNKTETSYVKIGSGPKTMAMLPGIAFKSTLAAAELVRDAYGELFKDYTIFLFDDRNHIDSDYSIQKRAEGVAAEMNRLGLTDAYVFGASMGGMVGQQLAIDHPELVKKLVLASTSSCPCEAAKQVICKWKSLVEKGEIEAAIRESISDIYSPATVAQFGAAILESIGRVSEKEQADFVNLAAAVLAFDSTPQLVGIQCPVLVTGSAGDRVLFPEGAKKLAEKLGCELFLYGPEYGHAVYDEAADHKERILAFFER